MLLADDVMIRPDGAGRLLLHSDAHDRRVEPARRGGARGARRGGHRAVSPHLELPARPVLESATLGLRALTEDYLPAVGWLPGSSRRLRRGHPQRHHARPLLGELIASEVAGSRRAAPAAFRPDRFAAGARHLTATDDRKAP